MTNPLSSHVSTVDASVTHKVDISNPVDFHSLQTDRLGIASANSLYASSSVSSPCAGSTEQGRTSGKWIGRPWQGETFVAHDEENKGPSTQTLSQNIVSQSRIHDLLQLSCSVKSHDGQEAGDFSSFPAPLEIGRLRVRRPDSCASTGSRREGHVGSGDFERMIVFTTKGKGPSSALSQVLLVAKEALPLSPPFEQSGSVTTDSESPVKNITASEGPPLTSPPQIPSGTTVLCKSSPFQTPTPRAVSVAAHSIDAIPGREPSPTARKPVQSRKPARFAPANSCSVSEQDQCLITGELTKPVFQIGDSSEEDGFFRSVKASWGPRSLLTTRKKHATSSSNVMTRTTGSETDVDSDTDDCIVESAIDDDDDYSDWEDVPAKGNNSSMDEGLFRRVEYKCRQASAPSLIALMLHQNGRGRSSLSDHASQAALSPCASRRGTLATVSAESAVLKRRHKSYYTANLKKFPEKLYLKRSKEVDADSYDRDLLKYANDGYNSRGW
ncbi:hypothetical protein FHETE_11040 [Fusarium heterosporum]|uniref:DUF3295 domain-containing protein n=1 Tax=Fusarium heterosporum TaxID=42747 RepID=A0A8H5WBI1_FUSHE|nr:hypothetical protein FHETE_11040 [Fusarium heterosporum]